MGLEKSGIEITGDTIKSKLLQETDSSVVTMESAFVSAKINSSKSYGNVKLEGERTGRSTV